MDSSADTNATNPTQGSAANWPDGAAIIATYQRSLASIGNGTGEFLDMLPCYVNTMSTAVITDSRLDFPAVPDINTFVNLGLNKKPTFFGCDASNLTGTPPLIVYLPNAPYVYNSNVSTFDLEYNDTERNAIVSNGYNLATQGNGTIDSDWPACVGCAILSRSFDRTNTVVPSICQQCFNRYCWDGTIDNSSPKPYQPSPRLQEVSVKGAAGRFTASAVLALAGAVLTTITLL